MPFMPGAAGAADAVNVIVGLPGNVEIDDVADAFDVEPAGRDIGRDEDVDLVLLEPVELGDADGLVHVALDLANRKARALEAARQLANGGLAVGEDDGVLEFLVAKDVAQRILLLVGADLDQPLLDIDVGGRRTGDLDALGVVEELRASFWIGGGMVAENSSVWRDFGSFEQISSMSGMKPMSSMRSASSITSRLQSLSMILPRPNRSISRPGVAISTSTPFSSALTWSPICTPPISSAIESG